jgi:hypothetical protein
MKGQKAATLLKKVFHSLYPYKPCGEKFEDLQLADWRTLEIC